MAPPDPHRHLPRLGHRPRPLTQLLPTGERVDNPSPRDLAAFPNVGALTDGLIDVTKADPLFGPYYAFAFKNLSKSVVAEAKLAAGLGLQVRYGHDARVNNALAPTHNSIFAPRAPAGNLPVDPATGPVGIQWTFNRNFPALSPVHTGAATPRRASTPRSAPRITSSKKGDPPCEAGRSRQRAPA